MIQSVTQQGRNLEITVAGEDEFGEPLAPYVIRPLPARQGRLVTEAYIEISAGSAPAELITSVLQIAVDGGVLVDGKLVPRPEEERLVFNRVDNELSVSEQEEVLIPALFWQTVLGLDGVNAYVESGGGVKGTVKALWALVQRLGISPQRTAPSTALENLIRLQESTQRTAQSITRSAKQPSPKPNENSN